MTSPLICDTYAGDLGGKTDIGALVLAGAPWHGWMGKATQGSYYSGGDWFRRHWPVAKDAAGDRYGRDWFRAAYHYLDVRVDAKAQADYYLSIVERAGGFSYGDLWPVVDVERAGQRWAGSAQLVVDRVSEWSRVVHQATGQRVILYGGSFLRELGVRDHMGCSLLWVADYEAMLPAREYTSIGWALDELFGWQYCGDGVGKLAGYPVESPIGRVDISTLTIAGGGDAALAYVRDNMCVTAV